MHALGYFTASALILLLAALLNGFLLWLAGKLTRLHPDYSSMVWCAGVSVFTNMVFFEFSRTSGHAWLQPVGSVVALIVLFGMLKRHTGAKFFPDILLTFVVALALGFGIGILVCAAFFVFVLINR